MPSVTEVLNEDREQMPEWLHDAGTNFDPEMIDNFFRSRVIYYPGAGQDGRAFALFGATHSAHCFLHIDFRNSAEQIGEILTSAENSIVQGYSPLRKITPIPIGPFSQRLGLSSALWTILQRHDNLSDGYGPERFAFLHIQSEAVLVCLTVWGRLNKKPFGVVLQNHGFGGGDGHPAMFGGESLLYQVARQTVFAKYLLKGDDTPPWPDYEPISSLSERGYGEHRNRVQLYCRQPDDEVFEYL